MLLSIAADTTLLQSLLDLLKSKIRPTNP